MWYSHLIEYLQMSLSARLSEDVASRWRWPAETSRGDRRLCCASRRSSGVFELSGSRLVVASKPDDRNLRWFESATKSGQGWNLILLWRICRHGAIFHTSAFRLIVHIKRTKLVNLNSVNRNPPFPISSV